MGEWRRLLLSPASYLTFVFFLLLWFFLFFRQVFLIGESSLRLLFDYLPWLGIIVVPALTMGAIARERSGGTLEWLLTRPIKESELVLGKFLAILSFLSVLILMTVPLAVAFSQFSHFDWGIYVTQVIGAVLLLAAYCSIGLLVSATMKEQLSALLVSVVVLFGLTIMGFELVTSRLPQGIIPLVSQVSFMTHASAISRGVIDIRDVWFLVVASLVFLSLAVLALTRDRYGKQKRSYRPSQIFVLLLSSVLVLSIIFSEQVPGRIDLTSDKLFSLEPVSQQILSQLSEPVTITLYTSDSVPVQLRPVLRDVQDILRDYDRVGGDKVIVEIKNPSSDPSLAQEAAERGVQEVQFNQISQETFQVNSGYLGVSVGYQDQYLAIPFVQNQGGLEYQLTSLIAQLTGTNRKTVAVTAGHGEKSLFGELRIFNELLSRQYELQTVNLTEGENGKLAEGLQGFDSVVIVGPTGPFESSVLSELQNYASAGGSLLVLAEGVEVDPQQLAVAPAQHSVNQVLSPFGVGVKDNLVYDTVASETVRLGAGSVQYLVPYPWWVRATVGADTPLTQKENEILLPWSSEVGGTEMADQNQIISLVTTSPYAGSSAAGAISIDPNAQQQTSDLREFILGVAVEKQLSAAATQSSRLVLVGDSDVFSDGVLQNTPENASFALDTIAWLNRDTSLAPLKLKEGSSRSLLFSSPTQPMMIMGVLYGLSILLPTSLGCAVWFRRRRLRERVYVVSDN